MRWLSGIAFTLSAVVLGLTFLDIFATKVTTGNGLAYFGMVRYGVGAAGCSIAGRLYLKRAAERATR